MRTRIALALVVTATAVTGCGGRTVTLHVPANWSRAKVRHELATANRLERAADQAAKR